MRAEATDPGHGLIARVIEGDPWFAYRDPAAEQLVVVACSDAQCLEAPVVTPIIVSGAPIDGSHIGVGLVNGGPAVFFSNPDGLLKVMLCGGVPACNDTLVRKFFRVVHDDRSEPIAAANLAVDVGGGVAFFAYTTDGALRTALLSERAAIRAMSFGAAREAPLKSSAVAELAGLQPG